MQINPDNWSDRFRAALQRRAEWVLNANDLRMGTADAARVIETRNSYLRGPHGSLRDALIAVGCEES